MVYIDDIVIFSKSSEEHAEHIHKVLQVLQDHHLVVKRSKCQFAMEQIKLLGYIVSKDGITSNPEKVAAIRRARHYHWSKNRTCYARRFVVWVQQVYNAPATALETWWVDAGRFGMCKNYTPK